MALVSSLKFNKTLNRLDLDREPKKENSVRTFSEKPNKKLFFNKSLIIDQR